MNLFTILKVELQCGREKAKTLHWMGFSLNPKENYSKHHQHSASYPLGLLKFSVKMVSTHSSPHVSFLCLKALFSPMGVCFAIGRCNTQAWRGSSPMGAIFNQQGLGWVNKCPSLLTARQFFGVAHGFSEDPQWDWALVAYSLTMENHLLLTHSLTLLNKAQLVAFLPFLSHFSHVFFCPLRITSQINLLYPKPYTQSLLFEAAQTKILNNLGFLKRESHHWCHS